MQGHTPHHLHVEVPLAQDPPSRLAHGGEGLHHQAVEGLTVGQSLPEENGLTGQLVVGERLHFGFELVDQVDELAQPADLLALAGSQDAREDAHEGSIVPAAVPRSDLGERFRSTRM